jgi:hypothetical protein
MARFLRKAWQALSQVPLLPPTPATWAVQPTKRFTKVPPPTALKQISERPLVFVHDNFVSADDCAAIREAALALRPENEYDGKQLVELPPWPDTEGTAVPHADVIESVFSRIDRVMGMERHAEEVRPKVHEYRPAAVACADAAAAAAGVARFDPLVSGFHVDINARPYRFATAILYLSTTSDGSGATIFPCASSNTTAINAATDLLASGIYHTDQAQSDPSVRESAEVLLEMAGDGDDSDDALFVRPEEGKLCLFFTCDDVGQCDPTSWHGAGTVHPQSSSSKWTLQCFKEIPLDARGTEERRAEFVASLRRRLRDAP